MANTFNVNQMISREVGLMLGNTLGFASMGVTRKFQDQFPKAGLGQTFSVQKPARFTRRTGATYSAQDYTPQSATITFTTDNQKGVDAEFTSYQLSLQLADLREQVIKPMVSEIAHGIDIDGLQHACRNTWNTVGTAGTTPSALLTYGQANAKLNQNAAPAERNIFLTSMMDITLVDAGKGLFNSAPTISKQFSTGTTHRQNFMGYNNWFVTENCYTHTVGTFGGTPLVNGASQTGTGGDNGTQSLITDGWTVTTTALAVGDVFSLANVNNVNPRTRATTGSSKQFVVRTASTTDGSGNSTIAIASTMTNSGTFQNVTGVAADNAAITMQGTSTLQHARGIALNPNAFGLVYGELPSMTDAGANAYTFTDPDSGVSVRTITQYSIADDKWKTRIDVLYAYFNIYPECACIIQA